MRYVELDGLRGALLSMMAFNHLVYWPFAALGGIRRLTSEPLGYASAAEGFIVVAGLVTPLVPVSGLGRRIARIYAAHVGMVVAIGLMLLAGARPYARDLSFLAPEQLGVSTFVLPAIFLNVPFFCEILPTYVILLALVPLLRRGLESGRTGLVLGLSVAVYVIGLRLPLGGIGWLLWQVWPRETPLAVRIFSPLTWQLLFVLAFVVSFHFQRGTLPRALAAPSKRVTAAALAVVAAFLVHRHFAWPDVGLLGKAVRKAPLAPLRIVNVAALALLARAFWPQLGRVLRLPFLRTMGSVSLGVFAYQVILIYVAAQLPIRAPWHLPGLLLAVASLYPVALVLARRRRRHHSSGRQQ